MQYWILYEPGVGGDGFACLLEHAANVYPADGVLEWRFHYYDGHYGELVRPIRFYHPRWCRDPVPFRTDHGYSLDLDPIYRDLIAQKKNTVVTAHSGSYWREISNFPHKNIVETDQVLVHLYSKNYARVQRDFFAKRHTPDNLTVEGYIQHVRDLTLANLNNPRFDIHIDIERAWNNWSYLEQCLAVLGIDLDRAHYDQYLTYID